MVDQTLLLTSARLPLCPGQHFCTTSATSPPIPAGENTSRRESLFPYVGSRLDFYPEVNVSVTVWNCIFEPSFVQRKYWSVGAPMLGYRPQSCLERCEEMELWVS